MLSNKLLTAMSDFVEAAEKQEKLIESKNETIQKIVGRCEIALDKPILRKQILQEIIEEHKEAL
ncbi:hypothetical protein RBU49_06760 [Clostridium sp. MB40-C1]|uniref:hypothetical protein n=1 Tax=Clostridium sp. MB40-C1 TaxID=3070996 RepID=UPI0027E1A347|nr:hypothetical protein [Clostridium sp. MB40-C1]WMJ81943.1 hypothetical protein RBU49_06760 [Clostridium sp. MB40-C1]